MPSGSISRGTGQGGGDAAPRLRGGRSSGRMNDHVLRQGQSMHATAASGDRRPRGPSGGILCRVGLGAGLAILMGLAGSAGHARQQVEKPAVAPPVVATASKDDKKADAKPAEKRYAFSMDGKPWKEVFTWLANTTGKDITGIARPTGTFTFISPVKRTYTMPEVIDIINETLLANSATQKFIMINRERNFTIVPADEKIDGFLLPRILPSELEERGRSELVQVIFDLKTMNATEMVPEVTKMMGPFKEITALKKSNQLLLQDTVGNLIRIKKTLADIENKTKPETLSTGDVDPVEMVKTITGMLGDTKAGAAYVEAVTERNAIIVRGTEEQIDEVKAIIKARTGETGGAGSRTRIITLEGGNATLLAEELARVMSKLRKNPIDIVSPDRQEKKADKPKEKGDVERLKAPPRSDPKGDVMAPRSGGKVETVSFREDEGGLVDPRETKKPIKDDRKGSADKPVRIFASGNRLLIASDDPEALALMGQLVNIYTKSPGKGDFTVLKLQNANATEAAKALDEAFNGPKQAAPAGGGGGRGNPFGAMFGGPAAAAAPANPEANRIRVVAYPATNSLLVRATPLDMLAIKDLLFNALDPDETDPRGQIRTYRIAVKYASATEIASWIKEVYKEQSGATNNVGGGFFARLQAAQDQTPKKPTTLSVGVDDRTNSLIVATSEGLYKDIKKMVDEIDEASRTATRTVKVVSIKGIDPNVVQQAIDAIQGKVVRRPTTGGQAGGGFGPSPFGGAPSFNPGGGGFAPVPGMAFPTGGGGGRPGGGGGRPGGGGGGRGPGGMSDAREPGDNGRSDFFAQRVKDDPAQSGLYDPQLDTTEVVNANHTGTPGQTAGAPASGTAGTTTSTITSDSIIPTRYQVKDPKDPKGFKDPKGTPIDFGGSPIEAPRSNVNVEALPELGVVIISGNNAADVEAVIKIIQKLTEIGVAGDYQIRLVPVLQGDASLISSILTEFYRRVVVGPSGTTRQATTVRPGPQGQTVEQLSSVVFLPYPRFNSILLAAPRARIEEILKQIEELDKPTSPLSKLTPFPLKKAPAARVASLISNIYASRFGPENSQITQVRVSFDDATNTVFVQAPPADLADITELIKRIDETVPAGYNDLRIVPIRFGLADEIAGIIQRAISQGAQATAGGGGAGVVPNVGGQQQRQPGAAGLPTQGGAQPGGGGAFPGGGGAFPGGGGAFPGGGGFPGAGGGTAGAGTGASAIGATGSFTKYTSLRFISALKDGKIVESGYLDDIRLIGDVRTNSIIVSAPTKAMDLILTLIKELDTLPNSRAEINIFTLKKADASTIAATLQQLFLGTGSGAPAGQAGGGGGVPGLPGGQGANPGTSALLGSGGLRPLTLTLGNVAPDGTPLIDLRLTVDPRTNSVIVAGSRNDLDIIEALITRLDDTEVQTRRSDVYALRNTSAVDVATALNSFLTQSLTVVRNAGQLSQFQDLEREVVVVPEPITNKLLISATPRYYPDIMRLVAELDAELPQVIIQVLIAEVDLTGSEEFGVEIGLQSPVLFQRGIFPAAGLFGTGTSGFSNTGTTLASGSYVAPGVSITGTVNPASAPNFNFNNPTLNLGQNVGVSPGIVGYQGLGSLGVGRVSPNSGVGGFVFSAASDSFNLLIRALKTQGRVDILSRPQVTTLDNQAASVQVGQNVPTIQGSNITGTGIVSTPVVYQPVGVVLNVVPKISPDGKVTMRVSPSVSSLDPTPLSLGNGVMAPVFNQQVVDTTVVARDGETVVIGGLIQRSDAKSENKVPWFGDLPWVGAAFRYRTQIKRKQELLIIMTPHIVRSRCERERILAMEGKRMDWILGDVIKTQGSSGMLPLFPTPPVGAIPPAMDPSTIDGAMPGPAMPSVVPITPAMPLETLPTPHPIPESTPPAATVPLAASVRPVTLLMVRVVPLLTIIVI